MLQPSGLGELAAIATAPAGRGRERYSGFRLVPLLEPTCRKCPQEGASRRLSPTLATRPIKYALEIWVELEVSPGVYGAPEDNSYGVDFAAETLNQPTPGVRAYTWMWPAIWWPSMGGRAIPRRASCTNRVFRLVRPSPQSPPGWMPRHLEGKCVSVAEANEIVTACKRLERGELEASLVGASAQVLRHATGFLIIGSRQTVPASGNFEFDVSGWSSSRSGRSCRP